MHVKYLAHCLFQHTSANVIAQDNNDFPTLFSYKNSLWHYLDLNTTGSPDVPRCIFIWSFSQLWVIRDLVLGWEEGDEFRITRVLCVRGRLQASVTNSFLCAVWQPGRDSMCFCWTELNGQDRENAWTHPTSPHPGALSVPVVALGQHRWMDSDVFQTKTF